MGTPPGEPTDALAMDEVRERAASGAALLGARGAFVYAVGIGANLVLASLLVPHDFGVVALGTLILVFGGYLADSGLGLSFIKREQPPERIELEAISGLQLIVTCAMALGTAAVAIPLGDDGDVVAAMAASLPIAVMRMPSVIVLERQLRYRTIALADVVEALVYYVWAIVAVLLGFGVWGLATAVIVRSFAGTATMIVAGPLGLLRPRWSWPHVRPVLAFGVKVQATALLGILREQGLNIGTGAIAGVATLGVWNLAWRVLQVPLLLFMTVGRVAFPAMSRLIGAGENPRRVIERGVAVLSALTGAMIVGIVGLSAALPELVGSAWHDVPAVLLWSGIGLIVGAPVTVGTSGYLYAMDRPGLIARTTLASMIAWFGVGFALLPSLGAPAIGIGWIAGASVSTAVLWRTVRRLSGAAIGAQVAAPMTIGLVATAAGWLVAHRPDDPFVGALLGFVAGEALLLGGLALLSRPALRDTRALITRALRSFRRVPAPIGS